MTTRARIRPSRENKSAKTPRGVDRMQSGKERDVSAGRSPKAPGRKPMRTQEPPVHAHIRALGIHLNQNTRTSIQQKTDRKFRKFAKSIEQSSVL